MTDTHCHLNHGRMADDLPSVMERALRAGVMRFVVIGFDLPTSLAAVAMAQAHASVWATVGIHPHDASDYDGAAEARLRDLAEHPRVVAIGEMGLDYHYDFCPRRDQERAFRSQLALAKECGLPIVVHCREAHDDTLALIETDGGAGVMHCWSGSAEDAARSVSLGLYIGVGGVVTFKNRGDLARSVVCTPRDRLLIETDAPYLAPAPYRGKRNEPAYLPLIAQELGALTGLSAVEVGALTDGNADRLFTRMSAAAERHV